MTSTRSTTRANIGRVHCHFPIADHRVRVAGVCTSCPIEPFLGDRELVHCANHERAEIAAVVDGFLIER